MKEKTTIFLSSTWADLEEHRKAILFTFARLQKWVEAMEYFGSLSGNPLEECLKAVQRSDIYIGVFGTRYGSKDEAGLSFTQREYEKAYENKKNILIYLIDEANHPVLPKFFDTGENAERLHKLRKLLKERHVCSFFSSPQDLAMKVGVDLIHHVDLKNSDQVLQSESDFLIEMPELLAEAGYSVGMAPHTIDISSILKSNTDKKIEVHDSEIRKIVTSGYVAINIWRGNYEILNSILTFDYDFWRLLIVLIQHYGVDIRSFVEFLDKCQDPLHFRLMVKIQRFSVL